MAKDNTEKDKLNALCDRLRLLGSVGVAFSESGYNNELYLKADAALYRTKEKGKCGITFHGE